MEAIIKLFVIIILGGRCFCENNIKPTERENSYLQRLKDLYRFTEKTSGRAEKQVLDFWLYSLSCEQNILNSRLEVASDLLPLHIMTCSTQNFI